jgi:predicted nuclease with TOPRIM domain
MTSKMKKETSSAWLAALDEHGIVDQKLWETLGSAMNPDTFHLWNIFQSKISIEHDRIDTLEKEKESLLECQRRLEKDHGSLLDRLVKLERKFDNLK